MSRRQLDIRTWRKRDRVARIALAVWHVLLFAMAIGSIVLYVLILAEPSK